jgi:hypothetical protein
LGSVQNSHQNADTSGVSLYQVPPDAQVACTVAGRRCRPSGLPVISTIRRPLDYFPRRPTLSNQRISLALLAHLSQRCRETSNSLSPILSNHTRHVTVILLSRHCRRCSLTKHHGRRAPPVQGHVPVSQDGIACYAARPLHVGSSQGQGVALWWHHVQPATAGSSLPRHGQGHERADVQVRRCRWPSRPVLQRRRRQQGQDPYQPQPGGQSC